MARPTKPKTELAQRLIELRGMEKREDFCARLGLSEGTYANYERGDRIPDAGLITKVSLSEGVRLDWLLLGEGPMRRDPASELASSQSGGMLSDREANALVDAVERKLEHLEEIPAKQPFSAELAQIYSDLDRVANAPGLPDEIKARADLPLRIVFEDKGAAARQKIREAAWQSRLKLANETVERALQSTDFEPANTVRQLLLNLVVANHVDENTLSWIIAELKTAKVSA